MNNGRELLGTLEQNTYFVGDQDAKTSYYRLSDLYTTEIPQFWRLKVRDHVIRAHFLFVAIISLCPHTVEGLVNSWGPFYKGTNPIQEDSTLTA